MQFFNKDDVLNAFHYRASTRSYDSEKKIPADDFRYILELGRLSPSSVGSEPWQFLVLQNAELRQKIKPYCWGFEPWKVQVILWFFWLRKMRVMTARLCWKALSVVV